jgi:hypothetical protein
MNESMRLLTLLLFSIFLSILTASANKADQSGTSAVDRAWQTALEPITLNLRNKLSDQAYIVKFVVRTVEGKATWTYQTTSEANAWQRPQFPVDFTGPSIDPLKPKEYLWSAHILSDNNKRVLGGRFIYPISEFEK